MMRIANGRRPGLSLTEVLVTLFVMAIGIISLMTLFPVGAMQMGQALRDDRCGQTASQADGITRLWWQTQCVECSEPKTGTLTIYSSVSVATLTMSFGHGISSGSTATVSWAGGSRTGVTIAPVVGNDVTISGGAGTNLPPVGTLIFVRVNEDSFFYAMDNPNYPAPASLARPQRAQDGNPSYPVFVDPIGWQARPATTQNWITGAPDSLPRRSVRSLGNNFQLTVRACSMMDDITFKEDSTPDTASGNTAGVVREGAYNWCAVIQRPNNSHRYVADFKVLVFHTKGLYGGHIPGSAPAGAETIYNPTSAAAGSTQVVLPIAIANLGIRSNSWVLDGSDALVANFYRVQSITELTATSTILELDTPLKSNVTQIYILRGLADVFDRPQLTNSGYHRQAP